MSRTLAAADNASLLHNPDPIDNEIDAVDALVIEQTFHGVYNILVRRESAAWRTCAHSR